MRTHFYRRPYRRWSWTMMKRWPLAIGVRHGTRRDRRIEESSERALANIVRIIPHICVDALCAMTIPATWSAVPNVDAAARVDLQPPRHGVYEQRGASAATRMPTIKVVCASLSVKAVTALHLLP